jgi:hypothetical protein
MAFQLFNHDLISCNHGVSHLLSQGYIEGMVNRVFARPGDGIIDGYGNSFEL